MPNRFVPKDAAYHAREIVQVVQALTHTFEEAGLKPPVAILLADNMEILKLDSRLSQWELMRSKYIAKQPGTSIHGIAFRAEGPAGALAPEAPMLTHSPRPAGPENPGRLASEAAAQPHSAEAATANQSGDNI